MVKERHGHGTFDTTIPCKNEVLNITGFAGWPYSYYIPVSSDRDLYKMDDDWYVWDYFTFGYPLNKERGTVFCHMDL